MDFNSLDGDTTDTIHVANNRGNNCFQYLPKKNNQIKFKKTIGLKKRIYWLNGTKEDKYVQFLTMHFYMWLRHSLLIKNLVFYLSSFVPQPIYFKSIGFFLFIKLCSNICIPLIYFPRHGRVVPGFEYIAPLQIGSKIMTSWAKLHCSLVSFIIQFECNND